MRELQVNTTYTRSISLTKKQLASLDDYDVILVKNKFTGHPIARLRASDVHVCAKQVYIEGKDGKIKLSPYFVHAF